MIGDQKLPRMKYVKDSKGSYQLRPNSVLINQFEGKFKRNQMKIEAENQKMFLKLMKVRTRIP